MIGDRRFHDRVTTLLRSCKTLLGVFAIAYGATAPFATGQVINPFDADPGAIRAGGTIYRNRCSECHGPDAKGLTGSDLTLLWQSGVSDERVFQVTRSGVPDTVMPPSTASDNDIWAIVAYLKSVSTVPPFVTDSGDLGEGRELFSSECSSCHTVKGAGGSLGPDLSRIAQVRSRDTLVAAIRDPSALIASDFKAVTLVTHDGARISGIKKGEDAFSIQILDVDERLRGYLKTEIRELIYEEQSLMEKFGPDRVTDNELEDLLAFLATLREDPIQ